MRRECRICMQRQLTFGGWVSPRNTRLRGQGAIEYVLVIAIIVLVVMMLITMCYKLDKTYKQMMAELSVRELSGKL